MLLLLLVLSGCGVNTTGDINIDVANIRYVKDGDICFAFIASRKSYFVSASGLGMTYVPCELLKGKR